MIRILADENLPPAVVGAIRQQIVEIVIETTHELGLDGSSDPELLEIAGTNNQVLLTMATGRCPALRRRELPPAW